jgi:hypothetical protein
MCKSNQKQLPLLVELFDDVVFHIKPSIRVCNLLFKHVYKWSNIMNKLSKLSLVLTNSLMVIFFSFIGINEVSAVTITGFELRLGPNFTKCLGISGRSKADGAVANVYDCMSLNNPNDIEGRLSQMWYGPPSNRSPEGSLVNVNSSKCLSLDGSNEAIPLNQRRYLQWGCIADHTYQRFGFLNGYFDPITRTLSNEDIFSIFLLSAFYVNQPSSRGCIMIAYEYNESLVVNCDAPGYAGANSAWKFVPVTINF